MPLDNWNHKEGISELYVCEKIHHRAVTNLQLLSTGILFTLSFNSNHKKSFGVKAFVIE
jgi:hypothetical protein